MEPLQAATLRTAPLPAGLAASLASAMLAANGAEAESAGDAWGGRALGALDRTPPPPPEEAVAAYAALLEPGPPPNSCHAPPGTLPRTQGPGAAAPPSKGGQQQFFRVTSLLFLEKKPFFLPIFFSG